MAKFLNQQLINLRRYAPGGQVEKSPPPPPDPDPTEDKPSEQTAGGFEAEAPPPPPETPSAKASAPGTLSPDPPPEAELKNILDRESGATRQTATRRELAELQRRRQEVMHHLHELRTKAEQEREALEARGHFFTALLNGLRQFPEGLQENGLRDLRRAVDNAHIECVKFERQREQRVEPDNGGPDRSLASLSFWQLSKIGGALLWPVLLALLLAGGAVAFTIYFIFSL